MTTIAMLAAVAAFVVVVSLLWLRHRSHVVRRIGVAVARLEERTAPLGERGDGAGGRLEWALTRLERVADRSNTRLAEERSERERLAAALTALDDGVVVVDERGEVVFQNTVAATFIGARHADALAEQTIRQLLGEALRGAVGEREVRLFGPPKRALLVRALPLADAGGAAGAVAVVRDVSGIRRIESVRRDFVANVSHELKTPVGALIALAETLAADDDPEVMRRLADRVSGEAERLGRIVDDLLDLSLIEAQEAPEREPVPVRVLVEEAVERVLSAAEKAGVHLEVSPPPTDLLVSCDRRQVVSALFNLLDNAVKYSPPEREGEPLVECAVSVDGDRGAIWVRDHGIGIPSRDQERIFERFYRVDKARSRASGGTGLGLAIVRHVARAHGGEVYVESREGEGSTFWLVLPLARSGQGASETEIEEVAR